MQYSLVFLAVVAMLGSVLGFQVAPRGLPTASRCSGVSTSPRASSSFTARPVAATAAGGAAPRASAHKRRQQRFSMQFGEGGGPIEKGTMPSYEEEQDKAFFNSELDNAPATEKVKDPVVIITLAWILGMFLLATGLILNGVN
ncbi:unnamed protein product [Ectocarpus sp. CCAP 1310/34]|nr:unnamed protein product [Ectocarpus sp. CCAP 1310/34]